MNESRTRCYAGVAALMLALAQGDASAGATSAALHARSLQLERAAEGITADAASAGLRVHVGAAAPEVWLREVWLQVDNGPMQHYQYSQQEAVALRAGGLHGLLQMPLSPGPHRIRAQAAAAAITAHANDARRRAAVDVMVNREQAPLELELSWSAGGVVKASTLKLLQWQQTTETQIESPVQSPVSSDSLRRYRAGDGSDPSLREVAFLEATGRRYPAERLLASLRRAAPALMAPETRAAAAASPGSAAMYAAWNALLAGKGDLAAIERLGAAAPCDAHPVLLCDQINTELGYALLKEDEGVRAAAAFRRVRSPGPQASAALLGLGWALLAPATAAERDQGEASPLSVAYGRQSRHEPRAMKDKERGQAMRAALVPWIEMIGRDPSDPAVQEAQIAVAWVMRELGSEVQAQDYYLRVIGQLEELLKRCDKATLDVARQPLAAEILKAAPAEAWHWSLADRLPDPRWWVLPIGKDAESFFLVTLIEQPAFAAAVDELRDAHEMQAALQSRRQQLQAAGSAESATLTAEIDGLLAQLAEVIAGAGQSIDRQSQARIVAIREQALRSLVEARYGLVHLYDRAAEVATK